MTFFAELKRRNVVRVGIAYVVGGWLLLQLTEVLSELLNLPQEIGPIVVSIVAIGLPVVLFVAWAYEMTPEGIKKEHEVDRTNSITRKTGRKLDRAIIAMLVLIAGYFIWESRFADREQHGEESGQDTAAEATGETVAPADSQQPPVQESSDEGGAIDPRSIAVLPFDNRSRLEEDEFFVEGIHDDLLTNLARIKSLKVISRTSMLRFKDTETPIPDIAAELGVATVMEGAVQRSGNTVRINVQLIDARTDEHLWADIFDRELTADNLFAIQSEISEKIAEALEATLSPDDQLAISSRPTENLEAYNAYLRGRQLMSRRSSEELEQAMVEFERAVELDPEFALAWVGIAETSQLRVSYGTLSLPEGVARQEQAAQQALAINDQLGEAWLSLAEVDYFHERRREAEDKYQKAIALSPGYALAYLWYSDFIDDETPRRSEALGVLRKAEQLDPLSSSIQKEVADQLVLLGRYDEAEAQLNRLIQMDPDFAPAYEEMAGLMGQTGRFDEQVIWLRRSLERDPGRITLYISMAFAQLDMGDLEALGDIRRAMVEIDEEHWSVGWLETLEALYQGNNSAALESAQWVQKELGNLPNFQNFFGFVHMFNRDWEKSRASFQIAHPQFFDRGTWREGLEISPGGGCLLALVMTNTGSTEDAADLVEISRAYLENELPNYVEHADRYGVSLCYLMQGDNELALNALETEFAHGHHSQWWIWQMAPNYEPLRGDPRFEAMFDEIRETAAQQRANLARMEAEAGP
jgi:TolB-like protein/Tfp pilus assembly protein PilF